MKRIETKSYAKINWTLRVGPRREDGFHVLETIFQSISLADDFVVERAESFSLECDDPTIPTDETNLITRAWRALHEQFGAPPVAVHVQKNIPAGGGLGGGSSNAATTLRVVRAMFDLDVDDAALLRIAASLGSDVAFFLIGGTAYATGRGEALTALPDIPQQSLSLILPDFGINTGECYGRLARLRLKGEVTPVPFVGLDAARHFALAPRWSRELLVNELEPPAMLIRRELRDIVERCNEQSSFAMMSGSGSTVYAVGEVEHVGHHARIARAETVSRETMLAL